MGVAKMILATVTVSAASAPCHASAQAASWGDVIWSLSACVDQFRDRQYWRSEFRTDWFIEQHGGPSPFIDRPFRYAAQDTLTFMRFPLRGTWRVEHGLEGEFNQDRFFCRLIGPGPAGHPSEESSVIRWIDRGVSDGVFRNADADAGYFTVCNASGRLAHVDLTPSEPEFVFVLRTQISTDADAILPIPSCDGFSDRTLGELNRPLEEMR